MDFAQKAKIPLDTKIGETFKHAEVRLLTREGSIRLASTVSLGRWATGFGTMIGDEFERARATADTQHGYHTISRVSTH